MSSEAASSKAELFAAWQAHLEGVRDGLLAASGEARAGTRVDGDHRPENRGERAAVTTQGYLAAGIGARLDAVNAALDLLDRMEPSPRDKVVTGAVAHLEDEDGAELVVALLPGGDGTVVGGVTVISPEAPIARALWLRIEDDEVELVRGGAASAWTLVEVG